MNFRLHFGILMIDVLALEFRHRWVEWVCAFSSEFASTRSGRLSACHPLGNQASIVHQATFDMELSINAPFPMCGPLCLASDIAVVHFVVQRKGACGR